MTRFDARLTQLEELLTDARQHHDSTEKHKLLRELSNAYLELVADRVFAQWLQEQP